MKIPTRQFTILLAVGLASMLCVSSPVKSMLGAERTTATEESNPNPYVTNGLIAMWDGEWNVGLGIHDSSSPTWVDLIGDKDVTLTAHGSFSDNALVCDGVGCAAAGQKNIVFSRDSIRTVEMCFVPISSSGIISTIAVKSKSNTGATGTIAFSINQDRLWCMVANSSSDGVSNSFTIPNDSRTIAISCLYSDNDLTVAYVNGEEKNPVYKFWGTAFLRINFGGRLDYTDIPFQGYIHSVRVYNRNLTDDEIEHNLLVDKERFGVE